MRKLKPNDTLIPEIGEGKRGETGHIGYLLQQAHSAYRIRMEHALQNIGLTLPQFSVLTMLAAYPKASGAELARLSLLTPQTMSVIIKNLERANLVSRRPHDIHGRIQIIEISDTGMELLSRGKIAVELVETALLVSVSDVDEKAVRQWLVQIAKQLDGA